MATDHMADDEEQHKAMGILQRLANRFIPANWRARLRNKGIVRLFLTGFSMGSADLVPGVSGGTMALIFGIYEELIHSVRVVTGEVVSLALRGQIRQAIRAVPWGFLVPVGVGMMTAIFTLARLISWLLDDHPVFIWAFFFGLVVASVIVVGRRVGVWSVQTLAALAVGAVLTYLLVGAVPVHTPATEIAFFLSGMVAIVAMILPGISGSFLLVLMGKYAQVLDLVTNREFITLGIFALGAVVGLSAFSRVLSYMFRHHHRMMMAVLTGVLIGSLRKVWPWKEVLETTLNRHGEVVPLVEANRLPDAVTLEVFVALTLMAAGVGLILYLSRHEESGEQE